MAVRKNRRGIWGVDFRFNHVRYRKRSPLNSRLGALAFEATLRGRLARGEDIEPKTVAPEELFGEFAERWVKTYAASNNKYGETKNKKLTLRKSLVPFFGKMPVRAITAQRIEEFKADLLARGLSPKTVNNQLTILNTCLVMAYDWLGLSGTPPKIRKLKCPPPSTDHLSPGECDIVLNGATGMTRDLVLVALHTGMRQGELKGLQWGSINWQNQSIVVQHSWSDDTKKLGSTKSNRVRHIPMTADVYAALFARKQATGHVFTKDSGLPLDDDYLQRRLRALCKRVGLRRIGWHRFRHTFASLLVMRGAPLNAVQALMGHSDIKTTMRYAHLAPNSLRQAIDMLSPLAALDANLGQQLGNAWTESISRERKNAQSAL